MSYKYSSPRVGTLPLPVGSPWVEDFSWLLSVWLVHLPHNESQSQMDSLNMLIKARRRHCACTCAHSRAHTRPIDRFMNRSTGQRPGLFFTDFRGDKLPLSLRRLSLSLTNTHTRGHSRCTHTHTSEHARQQWLHISNTPSLVHAYTYAPLTLKHYSSKSTNTQLARSSNYVLKSDFLICCFNRHYVECPMGNCDDLGVSSWCWNKSCACLEGTVQHYSIKANWEDW